MSHLVAGKKHSVVASLLATLLLACSLQAQFTANVGGTVTDNSGAVFPDASVTLLDTKTGVVQTGKTGPSGTYRFSGVGASSYVVTVSAAGFQTAKVTVNVAIDQTAGVNIALQPATATTTVAVETQAPGINPDETRNQYTLNASEINALPLQNRATLALVRLAPGASGIVEDATNIDVNRSLAAVSANGRFASSNLYLLDNVPINSSQAFPLGGNYGNVGGQTVFVPNPDSLTEVALQTNTYGVENGISSSLQTTLATKSGTNTIHGDGDYTYISRRLAALDYNQATAAGFHRHYSSGGIGGPIWKNHTFLFGSYQSRNELLPSNYQGNYATPEFLNFLRTNGPSGQNVNFLLNNPPTNAAYVGPAVLGSNVFSQTCGTPAAFNIPCNLPISRLAVQTAPDVRNGYQYSARLDHYMRDGRDRLYGYYFRLDQDSSSSSPTPNFSGSTPSTAYHAAVNYTHTFSPTLLNQFTTAITRFNFDFLADNPQSLYLTPFTGFIGDQSSLNLFTRFAPENNREHQQYIRDQVSWTKGRHTVTGGFEFAHNDEYNDQSGIWARPFLYGYLGLGDFLRDNPFTELAISHYGPNGGYAPFISGGQFFREAVYLNDQWKVRDNLLISVGIRWDNLGNITPYGKNSIPFSNFVLGPGAGLQQQVANGHALQNIPQIFNHDLNRNFLPRAAVAWSPNRNDKSLVIRVGAGLYQDILQLQNFVDPQASQAVITESFSTFNPKQPAPILSYGTNLDAQVFGFRFPTIPSTVRTPSGNVFNGADISGTDPNLKVPRTLIGNFAIEKEFPTHVVASLGYTGSYSYNQPVRTDLNKVPGQLLPGGPGLNSVQPEFGAISYYRAELESNYNAFIASVRQNWKNLTYQASYTWSHTLDDPLGGVILQYNPKAQYASSDFDVRHRFTLSQVYEFPGLRSNHGFVKALTGGWSLNNVIVWQTGTPFSVTNGNGYPNGDYLAQGVGSDYPSLVTPVKTEGFTRTQYENGIFPGGAAAFTSPNAGGTIAVNGNVGRNSFRNPSYFTLDTSIRKSFTLPWFGDQHSTLILRGEAANVLNHLNLQGVNGDINSAQFGQSTSSNQARRIQVGGRFEF